MNNIAVIGAGTMGNGIAHVFAQAGFTVQLVDLNADQLGKALATITKNLERQVQKGILTAGDITDILKRIHPVEQIKEGIREAGLIIEAATENESVKLRIFHELDENALPDAILASNTSSISITKIAAATL